MSNRARAMMIAREEIEAWGLTSLTLKGQRFTAKAANGKTEVIYLKHSSQEDDPDGGFNFSRLKSRPGDKVKWIIVWFDKDANANTCRMAVGNAIVKETQDGPYFRVATDRRGNLADGTKWKQVEISRLTE